MKTKLIKTVRVVLYLEENEAKWLKALTQNPIINGENTSEGDTNRRMRKRLFQRLKRYFPES